MATDPFDPSDPDGDQDWNNDEESIFPPRWWMIIWTVWGLLIGSIVLWHDGTRIVAAIWVLIGIAVGAFGLRLLKPLTVPIFDWYFASAHDREAQLQMIQLALSGDTQSDEYKRLARINASKSEPWMMAMISPLFGAFHGVLIGGVGGALSAFDPAYEFSASRGAAMGIVFGIVGVTFLAALVLSTLVPTDKSQPLIWRLAQRAWILSSPLFVFPVAWHCLKWVCKGRPELLD